MIKGKRSPVLITSGSKALLWDSSALVHRSAAVFMPRAAAVSDEVLWVFGN